VNLLTSEGETEGGDHVNPWDEMISRITPDLEAAEAELQGVTRRVEGLRYAIKYAQQAKSEALARQADSPAQPAPTPQETTGGERLGIGITDVGPTRVCEVVLREAEGTLKTQVIRERMNAVGGREFTPDQAKGALNYLLRKGRVERVGTALWRMPRAQVPSEDFTPTVGTMGVSHTGGNGTSTQALTFSPERA
jgi:hypothetical protein